MRAIATFGAVALLLVTAMPVLAAQKTGCPTAEEWAITTVEDAAETIWPALLDKSAFPGGQAEFEAALGGFDKNDDGWMCVKTSGGDELNPNSKWYRVGIELIGSPTQFFIPRDNNSGADD
jgi:hypothetical protein